MRLSHQGLQKGLLAAQREEGAFPISKGEGREKMQRLPEFPQGFAVISFEGRPGMQPVPRMSVWERAS